MTYCTLQQARAFVESGYGSCDEVTLTRVVNTIRQHFYSWYEEIALFLDATECFLVHDFCLDCNACHSTYRGVTLPRDFQTVEAIWWNDWPMKLHSSWKEFQTGISPECDCRLAKIDLPGRFCTFADVDARRTQRIQVRALSEDDIGKTIVVRGVAATGQSVSMEFHLTTEPQLGEHPLKSIVAQGGVVKDKTNGRVTMSTEDGELLAIYEPDETIPAYKRVKITGLPDHCGAVNIRAARQYYPLTSDNDVVEVNNAVALDAMARYLRLYELADKTRDSMAIEKDHYQTAFKMIVGDKSREEGRGTQSNVAMLTPRFGGAPRLNRGGRRLF